jgi:hypothetical protein
VKNLFGLFRCLFSASSVIYKSYRQILTPVDNLQHLLRLPIFDKTRLVAFHKTTTHRNYTNWFLPVSEKRVLMTGDLDSLHAVLKTIVAKRTPLD